MDESLIWLGSEVKAIDDRGKVGGYLVLFSSANDPDISRERDFFTKDTDFDFETGEKRSVYFSHGMDKEIGRKKFGRGTLETKDAGVWFEAILQERDEYEKKVLELVKLGKLGWSSGSAPHLVERKSIGTSNQILSWPIVEASLTHKPAEPRTSASILTIKSYQEFIGAEFEPLAGKTFAEELETALAAVEGGTKRAQKLRDIRVKEGRSLSTANRERLTGLRGRLTELQSELDDLLSSTEPQATPEEINGVLARYQLLTTGASV